MTPLKDAGLEAQLDDVLASSISPRLNRTMRLLEVDGGYILLLRVQQRSGPLHMVDAYGQNRYWVRDGIATRPMHAYEVEAAFRVLSGTDERLEKLVASLPLASNMFPPPVGLGYVPWVAVISAALDAGPTLLKMRQTSPYDFPFEGEALGDRHYIRHAAFEVDGLGYIWENSDEHGHRLGRLRLFRAGIFEWGWRYGSASDGFRQIPSATYLENVHDALAYFASVYSSTGYYGRIRVWIRIEHAKVVNLGVSPALLGIHDAPRRPSLDDLSYITDTNVETLLADPLPVVHEAMDLMWQGFGLPRCLLFDDSGTYVKAK